MVVAAVAKKYALTRLTEPSLKVVEQMIVKALDDNPNWNPINPTILARNVNRVKAKRTAKNPTDLFFFMELMPDLFYRGDVIVGSKRYLIFMTDEQLSLLKTAVRWYADRTFKVINAPFTQLFSFHGFFFKEWVDQASPPLFCFHVWMDPKRLPQSFRKNFEILGGECAIKELVTDFEQKILKGV